ncbi:hypothetical protein [Bradyrhizobium cenepequi]
MTVTLTKLVGYWHMLIKDAAIRTPYSEHEPRGLVVAYTRNVFPGARIIEA